MPVCLAFRPFGTSASALDLSGPGFGESLCGLLGNASPCTCAHGVPISGRQPSPIPHGDQAPTLLMGVLCPTVLFWTQGITLGALLVRSAAAGLGTLSLDKSFSGLGASAAHSIAAGSLAVFSGGLNSITLLLLGLAADLTGSFLSPEADTFNFMHAAHISFMIFTSLHYELSV